MSELALEMSVVVLADRHQPEGLGAVLVDGDAAKVGERQQTRAGVLEHGGHLDVAWEEERKRNNSFRYSKIRGTVETLLHFNFRIMKRNLGESKETHYYL